MARAGAAKWRDRRRGGAPPVEAAATAESTAAESTAPPPTEKVTIALDWTANVNYLGIYAAIANGYFEQQGIEPKILPYAGTPAEALIDAGKTDLAISYPPDVIINRAQGLEYKAVAGLVAQNTTALAVLASSKYQSPKDLNGKLYGGFGIQSDKALIPAILKADGVADPKFDEVVLNTAVIDALAKKRIAYSAVFTGIDDVTAELQGVKLRLFPYRDFLGAAGDYPNAVYVASDETIAERGDALKRALAALAEGYEWSAANPERGREDPGRAEQDRAEQAGGGRRQDGRRDGAAVPRRERRLGPAAGRGLRGPDADPRRRRRAEGRPARAGRPVHGRAAAVGALSVAHNAARMAAPPRNIVSLERIGKTYGAGPVLDDVSLGIAAGERIGVVGRNGGGKSTLLNLIARHEEPDAGRVTHIAGLRIGLLGQADELDPEATIRQAVVGGMADHEWAGDPRIRDVLLGTLGGVDLAGFAHGLDTVIGPLSGGERRRVALARLLLDGPELLLLDEPTNHLDLEGVDWLARHLAARRGAVVVVTHDRWFLDAVCERTWEVDATRVLQHEGGYAAWVLARAERERVSAATEERRRNLLRKELAWLRRGPPARTSKPQFRIDAANALIADEPEPRDRAELLRFATARLGRSVLDVEDATVELGERTILRRVTWRLGPGDRVGVVGVNGSGKTTLLRLLAGDVAPSHGVVKTGQTVKLAVLSQHLEELDGELRVLQALESIRPRVALGDGRELTASPALRALRLRRQPAVDVRGRPLRRRAPAAAAHAPADGASRTCCCSTSPPTTSTSTP